MFISVISKYAVIPGFGSNPRWFWIAKCMIEKDHKVEVITSDSNHGSTFNVIGKHRISTTVKGVRYDIIKSLPYKETRSIARVVSWFDFDLKLFRYYRDMAPDVVVISSLSLTSIIFGIYLKRRYGSCLVFEIRDIWPLTMILEGGFSKWHPLVLYLRLIETWGYRRADLIVGTMPNLKQHVVDSGIIKPENAFHTCGIGVSPDCLANITPFDLPPQVEGKLDGRTIIGYCGSIGLTNNLHDFVDYMEACDRDDVFFVIAGDGADRKKFQRRLEGYENVVFLGKISADQVYGFLQLCDILFLSTLPSKVWEFGQSMNKVVDYMLAGKYIVAQYTGYQSFINEAECGVFTNAAELGNCLDAAIDMPVAVRDAAGLAGREWILKHQNYEKLASEYLQKIEECVDARL